MLASLNQSCVSISSSSPSQALLNKQQEALDKALKNTASAAALGNKLLQDAFKNAAGNEDFRKAYFENFDDKQNTKEEFRRRLRTHEAFKSALLQYFVESINAQIGEEPAEFWRDAIISPTVNQDERKDKDGTIFPKITHVILHHTAGNSADESDKHMAKNGISAHYLIGRSGELRCLVPEKYRAWHAGLSQWGEIENVNFCSIGIELDNKGDEEFSENLINTLLALLKDIKSRHNILTENFIGHADVAPGRKVDPSRFFRWDQLGENGFGLWLAPGEELKEVPENFDVAQALKVLGYKVEPLEKAIFSFNLKLGKEEFTLDDEGKRKLYNLSLKKENVLTQQTGLLSCSTAIV